MERTGRCVYPVWRGASPQRRKLPAHCELALRNPGGDCGSVLRLDVEENRLGLSLRPAPRRRGHLLALLLPGDLRGNHAMATIEIRSLNQKKINKAKRAQSCPQSNTPSSSCI